VVVDGYRLNTFEIRGTRIRCELKAEDGAGNGCIMWHFMMCSSIRYVDFQRILAGWIGCVACMGGKRI
jgi:hypothetical protein